jgi:hypothetical protein
MIQKKANSGGSIFFFSLNNKLSQNKTSFILNFGHIYDPHFRSSFFSSFKREPLGALKTKKQRRFLNLPKDFNNTNYYNNNVDKTFPWYIKSTVMWNNNNNKIFPFAAPGDELENNEEFFRDNRISFFFYKLGNYLKHCINWLSSATRFSTKNTPFHLWTAQLKEPQQYSMKKEKNTYPMHFTFGRTTGLANFIIILLITFFHSIIWKLFFFYFIIKLYLYIYESYLYEIFIKKKWFFICRNENLVPSVYFKTKNKSFLSHPSIFQISESHLKYQNDNEGFVKNKLNLLLSFLKALLKNQQKQNLKNAQKDNETIKKKLQNLEILLSPQKKFTDNLYNKIPLKTWYNYEQFCATQNKKNIREKVIPTFNVEKEKMQLEEDKILSKHYFFLQKSNIINIKKILIKYKNLQIFNNSGPSREIIKKNEETNYNKIENKKNFIVPQVRRIGNITDAYDNYYFNLLFDSYNWKATMRYYFNRFFRLLLHTRELHNIFNRYYFPHKLLTSRYCTSRDIQSFFRLTTAKIPATDNRLIPNNHQYQKNTIDAKIIEPRVNPYMNNSFRYPAGGGYYLLAIFPDLFRTGPIGTFGTYEHDFHLDSFKGIRKNFFRPHK